jgi:hypothetical protein
MCSFAIVDVMQRQRHRRLDVHVDFKVVLIGEDGLDGKLTEVDVLGFDPDVKQYDLSLDCSCCWIDDELYEVVRVSSILGLRNAELGDLEHLLGFLAHHVVVVLQTDSDVLNCAVDWDACGSFVPKGVSTIAQAAMPQATTREKPSQSPLQ